VVGSNDHLTAFHRRERTPSTTSLADRVHRSKEAHQALRADNLIGDAGVELGRPLDVDVEKMRRQSFIEKSTIITSEYWLLRYRTTSNLVSDRAVVQPVSCPIGCVMIQSGHAAAKHQGLSLMAWAGGAVELRSTSSRSLDELAQLRTAYNHCSPCEDCTFVDKFITRAGS